MTMAVCGVTPFCKMTPKILIGYWFLQISFSVQSIRYKTELVFLFGYAQFSN